jgi:hypothetical protein
MRLKALSCLVVGAVGFSVAGAGTANSADSGRTFAAASSAEGMRSTFEAPQFLVVSTLFDAANPISQSALESTGVSRSFASAPYPGDLVVTAPGTLAAFGGPSLPVQYPFYVAAVHPEAPKGTVADPAGAYSLTATAEAARSGATGRLSVPQGPVVQTEALTELLADGAVRAVASSVTEGIVAGDGVLTIGRVVSSLETVFRPGSAEPTVTRHFEISGARVGDTAVEITADGVKVAGTALPIGDASAPVRDALAKAGLDVRVEGDEALHGGGTARTLVIRSTQQAPIPGAPQGVLTIRVGGAAATVLTGAAAAVDLPGSLGAAPPVGSAGPSPDTSSPVPDSAPAETGDPVGSGAVRPTSGSTGTGLATAPAGDGSAAGEGSVGAVPESDGPASDALAAGPSTAPIVAVPTALPVRRAVRWIFAVLAAGGALALAGSATFRRRGVQTTWM